MRTLSFVVFASVLLFASLFYANPSPAEPEASFITIGTGSYSGVYYPTGHAIAKLINAKQKEYGIRATVESTSGSVFNINAVLAGDIEFGIAQSDRQYQAIEGIAEWKNMGPQKDLRAIFSIYTENVDLIAAVDSGINTFQDLKGKRVNVGNYGSGQRKNAIDALAINGLLHGKDFQSESMGADKALELIQEGRIDAAFYTVGHPSEYYRGATSGNRKVKFIVIPNAERLVGKHSYYTSATTSLSHYPGAANTKGTIDTFGVKATFVTSVRVSEELVYTIVKEIFERFDRFVTFHPAYAGLTKEGTMTGLSAPIHSGAMKYYREVGLR